MAQAAINRAPSFFWSSLGADSTGYAWGVGFLVGYADANDIGKYHRVRCVR